MQHLSRCIVRKLLTSSLPVVVCAGPAETARAEDFDQVQDGSSTTGFPEVEKQALSPANTRIGLLASPVWTFRTVVSREGSLLIAHHLYVDIIHPGGVQTVQLNAPKHAARPKHDEFSSSSLASLVLFYLSLLKASATDPFSSTVMFPQAISANWRRIIS